MTLAKKELAGSRLACLALTSGSDDQLAERLTRLTGGLGVVAPGSLVMPRGLRKPDEAQLGEDCPLLKGAEGHTLTSWWLAVSSNRAKLPTWDIAARCQVQGKPGLLLVEAKAHDKEPDEAGKRQTEATNLRNHESIRLAIAEASDGLNTLMPGWALSRDRSYQLSNRFAWAWKLATMKVPVILVFLGVIHADEMASRTRRAFATFEDWQGALLEHARGIVPKTAWDEPLYVAGTPLISLIKSVRQEFEIQPPSNRR